MRRSQFLAAATLTLTAAVLLAAGEFSSSRVKADDDAVGGENQKTRQALAERCVKAAPTEVVARMACGRIATVRSDIPESRRKEFAKAMKSELDLDVMAAKRIEVMARTFTEAELRALAEFYESPHGHSAWQKLDSYVVDMQSQMKSKMEAAESRARKTLALPARE